MSAGIAGTSGIGVRARPAAVGALWLRGGVLLFRRRPIPMLSLAGFMLVLTTYLFGFAPALLRSLSLLLYPAILQVMLTMSRAADQGDGAGTAALAAIFGDPKVRLRMLQLGIVFALAFGVLEQCVQWLPDPTASTLKVDGAATESGQGAAPGPSAVPGPGGVPGPGAVPGPGDVPGAATAPNAGADAGGGETAGDAAAAMRLLVFIAAMIPVLFIVQFATALVSWHGMPSIKALFFAFFASWRNRSPILIYLLALFGLVALVMVLLLSMALIFQFTQPTMVYLLLTLLPLLLLPVLAASGYVMVRDVIVEDGTKE